MKTPLDMLDKLGRLDIDYIAETAIVNTDRTIAKIQQEQLFQGIRSDDSTIAPQYAAGTIAAKRRKGQPTDRVTLKDTGAFYSGIIVDVRRDLFIIDSADSKSASLQERYGKRIFGLNFESRVKYMHTLRPEFFKLLRAA